MISQLGQLPLLLECLIPVPAFQNFDSSGVPDHFPAAFFLSGVTGGSPLLLEAPGLEFVLISTGFYRTGILLWMKGPLMP